MPKDQTIIAPSVRMEADMAAAHLPMVRLPRHPRPHQGWNPIGRKAYRNSGMPGSMRRAHAWAKEIFA